MARRIATVGSLQAQLRDLAEWDTILTLKEAGQQAHLAPISLQQAIRRGSLHAFRLGHGPRADWFTTEQWLAVYLRQRHHGHVVRHQEIDPMANLPEPKYTLVMHSGGGWGDKPGFQQAVEELTVSTEGQAAKVRTAGGVLFDSYTEAADRALAENYPPEVSGLYPRVRGTFSKQHIDGLRIYIPSADSAAAAV